MTRHCPGVVVVVATRFAHIEELSSLSNLESRRFEINRRRNTPSIPGVRAKALIAAASTLLLLLLLPPPSLDVFSRGVKTCVKNENGAAKGDISLWHTIVRAPGGTRESATQRASGERDATTSAHRRGEDVRRTLSEIQSGCSVA